MRIAIAFVNFTFTCTRLSRLNTQAVKARRGTLFKVIDDDGTLREVCLRQVPQMKEYSMLATARLEGVSFNKKREEPLASQFHAKRCTLAVSLIAYVANARESLLMNRTTSL